MRKPTPDVVQAAVVRAAGHPLTSYQRAFLSDPAPLRAVLKARQTGFSWLFALEALANAIAHGGFSIFVSLNREEAAEKLLYARDMYDALPPSLRPRLLRASANELRLAGGGRLLSYPCRAPRGKARASLYLDEMAFYQRQEQVYSGALPVVSHGGRVVVASTPCGERGMFWRAVRDPQLAGQFSRHEVPWWRAPWFCSRFDDGLSDMETEDRVQRFGSPVLQRLFAAMEREAFQQEYELRFLDANEAFLPWDEIHACVEDVDLAPTWPALRACASCLYAGMDVGRWHDATEIVVLALEGQRLVVRAIHTLRNRTYDEQEQTAVSAVALGGVLRLYVDATGLGEGLAERLYARFPRVVAPVKITAPLKLTLAADLRRAMQAGELVLPRRRDLLEQLHTVRRTITESSHIRLDAPHAEHHADQFWALALALHAAHTSAPHIAARRL